MEIKKQIRVLIVDDSILFREIIARELSKNPLITIVATAEDPFDARDKILKYKPDVMTCDVEMPKMNGIEFIKRLLPQYPLPVIIVSSVSEAIFDAMSVGAVDFVTKPNMKSARNKRAFFEELTRKIPIAAKSKVMVQQAQVAKLAPSARPDSIVQQEKQGTPVKKVDVIAIGASTGGTEAVYNLLKRMPNTLPGIVIVQHIPAVFSRMFAERLNNQTNLTVKEAVNGDLIEQGCAYIAPGEKQMQVVKDGFKYKIKIYTGDKVSGHSPSVDVLFDSVANTVGPSSIGIIMTGMGYDGSKGLLAMRRKGALTIGQDEKSCVVYGMPKVAHDIGAVQKQGNMEEIQNVILGTLNKGRE